MLGMLWAEYLGVGSAVYSADGILIPPKLAPPCLARTHQQNILINEQCDVKLCDFGSAREYCDSGMTTMVTTQYYRAPELLLLVCVPASMVSRTSPKGQGFFLLRGQSPPPSVTTNLRRLEANRRQL